MNFNIKEIKKTNFMKKYLIHLRNNNNNNFGS